MATATTKNAGKGKTHTLPTKKAIIAKDVAEQLKNGELPARKEKKADERFLRMSMNTYINAIGNGLMHRQATLCWELAVDLSVYSQDADKKKAQETLFFIYAEAGYECKDSKGVDYKTVHRRISYGYELFQWIGGKAAVDEIVGAASEMKAIQALVTNLEQYGFKGMNDVMARVGKAVQKKERVKGEQPSAAPIEKPQEQTAEQPSDADKELLNRMAAHVEARHEEKAAGDRRSASRDVNAKVVKTEHIRLVIPSVATKSELMQLAMEVMQLANAWQPTVATAPAEAATA